MSTENIPPLLGAAFLGADNAARERQFHETRQLGAAFTGSAFGEVRPGVHPAAVAGPELDTEQPPVQNPLDQGGKYVEGVGPVPDFHAPGAVPIETLPLSALVPNPAVDPVATAAAPAVTAGQVPANPADAAHVADLHGAQLGNTARPNPSEDPSTPLNENPAAAAGGLNTELRQGGAGSAFTEDMGSNTGRTGGKGRSKTDKGAVESAIDAAKGEPDRKQDVS